MADITIKQAAEYAHQAEVISRLIEFSAYELDSNDLAAVSALLRRLTGGVAAFLVEMEASQEVSND
ncbi:hypothetical protein [Mixta calida]|uniref:hypothetical protein n=1 Tax=Mixta calida TaxID=665913 RepID=UPI00290DF020|nr:hypothetical protein [Mixta calida]MDU6416597.1 hypothetical protein [Mixta calida]